ncbi:MAG: hypothetical protein ABJO27_27985 [Pseudoruegeria sp.]
MLNIIFLQKIDKIRKTINFAIFAVLTCAASPLHAIELTPQSCVSLKQTRVSEDLFTLISAKKGCLAKSNKTDLCETMSTWSDFAPTISIMAIGAHSIPDATISDVTTVAEMFAKDFRSSAKVDIAFDASDQTAQNMSIFFTTPQLKEGILEQNWFSFATKFEDLLESEDKPCYVETVINEEKGIVGSLTFVKGGYPTAPLMYCTLQSLFRGTGLNGPIQSGAQPFETYPPNYKERIPVLSDVHKAMIEVLYSVEQTDLATKTDFDKYISKNCD